jgi:alpha-L-fucosidase
MDWHSPDQAASRPDPEHPSYNPTHFLPGRKADYIRYMKQELSELITRYHPAILWFDGGWMADWTDQDGRDLYQYLRSLDPALIINNRVKGAGDYETPEQEIPATGLPGHDWETCMTINNSWGYNARDDQFKSTRALLHNLIDIASKGGNYLLNVGPTAEGLIPQPEVERLEAMGQWLKVNGEAIYGTSASPFRRLPFDGRCTQKPGRLYLHVFDWPANSQLLVPVSNRVRRAYLLSDRRAKLAIASGPNGQTITLPPTDKPDPNATVVAVEIEGPPRVIETTNAILPAADGTLTLNAQDADILGTSARLETRGDHSCIGYWTNAGDRVRWLASITRPGTYGIEATFACQPGDEGSTYAVSVGDQQVTGTVTATKDWDTFQTVSLGPVHLDKPGTCTVLVTPTRMPAGAVMNLRSVVLKPEG